MNISDLDNNLQGIFKSARVAYDKVIECYERMEPLSIYSGKYIDLKVNAQRYNYIYDNCVQYLRGYFSYDEISNRLGIEC